MKTITAITVIFCLTACVPYGSRWIAAVVIAVLCAFFPGTVLLVLFSIIGIRVLLYLLEKEIKR